MAQFKYFYDIDGQTIELVSVTSMDNEWFAINFPGVKAIRDGGYSKRCGRAADGRMLPMTRFISIMRVIGSMRPSAARPQRQAQRRMRMPVRRRHRRTSGMGW